MQATFLRQVFEGFVKTFSYFFFTFQGKNFNDDVNQGQSCDIRSKFKQLVLYLNMPAPRSHHLLIITDCLTTKVVPCVVVGALNCFFFF